jgi:hypothetical protein
MLVAGPQHKAAPRHALAAPGPAPTPSGGRRSATPFASNHAALAPRRVNPTGVAITMRADPLEKAAELHDSDSPWPGMSQPAANARDLAGARIHADPHANEQARRFGARAYTLGTDIYFGPGEFAPQTRDGQRLLAHELAHVAQVRSGLAPPGLVLRQVAARLEYDNLAERIHKAIAGLGTDEEAVYLALQQLERDPTAIARLESTYLARYGVSLEADIRDDFSGTELEYALQLLGRGTAGAAQEIGAVPALPAEFDAAARRLHVAVDIWGTDEEAIYAVLRPFNRDIAKLDELRNAYFRLFREDLRDRIVDEMSGDELAYALYLLGGAPIRAQPEITEMTTAQVTRVFTELAGMTFWTDTNAQAPIPFHYPPDGCYFRAQMMAERLTELGFASEKVFAISRFPGPGLRVETPLAGDVSAIGMAPAVTWWYHVAPIVRVRNALGVVTETVLDPSLAAAPLTLDQWLGRMSSMAFTRQSADDVKAHAEATGGQYAPGDHFVFTFDRDAYDPSSVTQSPTPESAHAALEAHRHRLTGYAQLARVHDLAAAIRARMVGGVVDVPGIIAAIGAAPRDVRLGLWVTLPLEFPNLRAELMARVAPADWLLIDAEVNRP